MAGAGQTTPSVPREINPVWKHSLMFPMLGRGDVLRFSVRDTGLFASEHLGGTLGPRVVAQCTLKVGDDFQGYLDMVPSKEGVGEPVLKVLARFLAYHDPELPPAGVAAAMAGVYDGPQARQAFAQATAPALEESTDDEATDDVDVGKLGREQQSAGTGVGGAGVGGAGVGASGAGAGMPLDSPPDSDDDGGVDGGASGGWDVPEEFCNPSSSPFFVDMWVVELRKPNLLLQHLHAMQQRGEKGMFPSGAFRNYNCWAAGFDLSGDWDEQQLWGPVPKDVLPAIMPDVLERLRKLNADRRAPAWTWGVGMLVKLLERLEVQYSIAFTFAHGACTVC